MCRIAGIIDPKREREQLGYELKAMCSIMAHGGPDDEGYFIDQDAGIAFGHRRLSLIDLSLAGHQPMFYHHEQLIITFNGEIYNYQELKTKLLDLGFTFQTQSDTEVILASYKAWGTESFNKFKGMFAFALHDRLQAKTYLVRDPSGIKPLYYYLQNKQLLFASEVKAFASTNLQLKENSNWKIYFLAFGHLPEPYTTFENIEMLAKGTYLVWNHQKEAAEIYKYHQPKTAVCITDEQEAKQKVHQCLHKAVKRHLIADAPIGIFLSGGIDSSILSLLAAEILSHKNKYSSKLKTLSINFSESRFSEKAYQDLIAKKINGDHAEYLINAELFNQYLPDALKAMDQPSMDGINSWFVNYFAKQNGLKSVISGIGGDELFGGYPSFNRMPMVDWLSKLPAFILKKATHFRNVGLKRIYYLSYGNTTGQYLFLRGIFTPDRIAQLLGITQAEVDDALSSLCIAQLPDLLTDQQKASWLETHLYMQNQLLKETDFMSMQHGVEVRVPFLDRDFIAMVNQIDSQIRYPKNKAKGLLIDSFLKELPKPVWDRKKMGFTFPFQVWLRKNAFFLNGLSSSNQSLAKLKADFIKGDLHWSKAMVLYQLNNFKV